MSIIEAIIMTMLDGIEYIIISNKLINGNKSPDHEKRKILFYFKNILALSMTAGILSEFLPSRYSIMAISVISMVIMTFILYRKKIKETIYIYLISMIIFLLIQFVVLITLNHLGIELDSSFNDGLIAHTIILPITIAISRFIPINTIFNYVNKNNSVFKYLSLNIFIILISLLSYWYINIDGILKNTIIIAVVLTWVILVNFVLLKNGLKNELEEQQLRIYEEYLPVIDELISEIRKRQHEFDNHIQALKMITVTSEDYESVIGSMKHYMKDLEVTNDLKDLIKIDNKILAGFLYNKIKNAEKLDIEFDIIIRDYEFNTGLKDYELVEVMGNLINNAFETEVEDNYVILTLLKERDMNVIEIKNKHPYLKKENLDKIFSKGFSTKSSTGRGYGLYNVKKIVEKYNGKIEILNKSYRDENYVVFKVLFVRN